MGNTPRILLRIAAFFLTIAIICTISATTLTGGVSADDDPGNLVPGISPAPPKTDGEGGSSNPPITRNSTKPISSTSQPPASQPPASQPPASQPPASQPPASQPPASQPPASNPPAQPAAPAGQASSTTSGTMPAAMPATGSGFMAAQSLSVRAVLNGAALISILLAVTCASTGLAIARQRLGSSR